MFLKVIFIITICVCVKQIVAIGDGTNDINLPQKELDILAAWKKLDFGFPSEADKQCAIKNGLYNENVGIPFDIAVHYSKNGTRRIWTTVPKRENGIPYSVALVTKEKGPNGPILQPYPDYYIHLSNGDDCDGITSSFSIEVDECDRMWILDTGKIGSKLKCPPQILIIDLNSDQLIHRYRFPKSQYISSKTIKVTIFVDIKRNNFNMYECSKAMAYISDNAVNNLIVYDLNKDDSWLVKSRWMYPNPKDMKFNVAGEEIILFEGLISAIPMPSHFPNRKLFFHPLSSLNEFSVPLKLINNKTAWKNYDSFPHDEKIKVLKGRNSQIALSAIDRNANLYGCFLKFNTIVSWDTTTPHIPQNFKTLAYNLETLQFASGMQILYNPNRKMEELIIVTNRLQKTFTNVGYNFNEINFRIMCCLIDDLRRNIKKCRPCN